MSKCKKHSSNCDDLFNPEWCETNDKCYANFYYPLVCDTSSSNIVLSQVTSATPTCQPLPLLQIQPILGECRRPSNKWEFVPITIGSIRAFGIKIPKGCGGCYLVDLIVRSTSFLTFSIGISALNNGNTLTPIANTILFSNSINKIVCLNDNQIISPSYQIISSPDNTFPSNLTITEFNLNLLRLDDCRNNQIISPPVPGITTLSVTKTGIVDINPGQANFTLTITNGSNHAVNVNVVDVITASAGFTITTVLVNTGNNFTLSGLDTNQATASFSLGTIVAGATIVIRIEATASDPGATITNTATVSAVNAASVIRTASVAV